MLPAMDPKTVDIYETKAAAWVPQKQRTGSRVT